MVVLAVDCPIRSAPWLRGGPTACQAPAFQRGERLVYAGRDLDHCASSRISGCAAVCTGGYPAAIGLQLKPVGSPVVDQDQVGNASLDAKALEHLGLDG